MYIMLLAVTLGGSPVPPAHPAPTHHAAAARPMTDADILGIMAQTDVSEIEAATLATTMASSKAVRDYAQMLITDHKKSMSEGKALAQKLNITPTMNPDTSMARDHASEMVKLHAKKGSDFDKEFIDHEAKDHQQVIDKVNKDLLPDASSPELKQLLRNTLPVLNRHESAAKALQGQLK